MMQTSGPISIGQALNEWRAVGIYPNGDAGDAYLSKLAGVASGQRYAWSYWYGKSAAVVPTHAATFASFDVLADHGAYISFNLVTMAQGSPYGDHAAGTTEPGGGGTPSGTTVFPIYNYGAGGPSDWRCFVRSYTYFNIPFLLTTENYWAMGLNLNGVTCSRFGSGFWAAYSYWGSNGTSNYVSVNPYETYGKPFPAVQPYQNNNQGQCGIWFYDSAGGPAEWTVQCALLDTSLLANFQATSYSNYTDSGTGNIYTGYVVSNGMLDYHGNPTNDWTQCFLAIANGVPFMGPYWTDGAYNTLNGYQTNNKIANFGGGIFAGTITSPGGGTGSHSGGGDSCFVAGTKVLMSDRTWKEIQTIQAGDEIMGPTGPAKVQRLHISKLGTNRKLLTMKEDPRLKWSAEHPFWVRQDGKQWWWSGDHVQIRREIEMGLINGLKDPHSFLGGEAEYATLDGFVPRTPIEDENQDPETLVFIPVCEGMPCFVNGYMVGAFMNEFSYDYTKLDWTEHVDGFKADSERLKQMHLDLPRFSLETVE